MSRVSVVITVAITFLALSITVAKAQPTDLMSPAQSQAERIVQQLRSFAHAHAWHGSLRRLPSVQLNSCATSSTANSGNLASMQCQR